MVLVIILMVVLVATRSLTNAVATLINSHQRCSIKEGGLNSFAKFTEKDLCKSLFLKKVAGPRREYRIPLGGCF